MNSNLELLQRICADIDGPGFELAMLELLEEKAEESVVSEEDDDLN